MPVIALFVILFNILSEFTAFLLFPEQKIPMDSIEIGERKSIGTQRVFCQVAKYN
jgi:hypothetical protein